MLALVNEVVGQLSILPNFLLSLNFWQKQNKQQPKTKDQQHKMAAFFFFVYQNAISCAAIVILAYPCRKLFARAQTYFTIELSYHISVHSENKSINYQFEKEEKKPKIK